MPIFMKLTDGKGAFAVVGESRAKGHEKWIELESASHGNVVPGAGTGYRHREGALQSRNSEIVVTKLRDASSDHLYRLSVSPILRMDGRIDFVREGKDANSASMSLTLEDLFISSYSISMGGAKPMETLSLNFERIKYS